MVNGGDKVSILSIFEYTGGNQHEKKMEEIRNIAEMPAEKEGENIGFVSCFALREKNCVVDAVYERIDGHRAKGPGHHSGRLPRQSLFSQSTITRDGGRARRAPTHSPKFSAKDVAESVPNPIKISFRRAAFL